MQYRDRTGKEIRGNDGQDRVLNRLYGSKLGRVLVKGLAQPWVSRLGGAVLNSRLSALFVPKFARKHGICGDDYPTMEYPSYNAFFCRKILPEKRPIAREANILISPCDGKLRYVPLGEGTTFTVKHTQYTLESLTKNPAIAEAFMGGTLLIFRLTVDDYHRYCYIADGTKTENTHIQGIFHSVNPAAEAAFPLYKENTREYCLLHTQEFGQVLMMEVGAMLVGKIQNLHGAGSVTRGQEKGHFEFGGSTVILCLQKDKIRMDGDIVRNSSEGIETLVRMGEAIGTALCTQTQPAPKKEECLAC